ncbi:hypothetical protein WDW89_21085 [Deltaproteobacteria bacterium TL4]
MCGKTLSQVLFVSWVLFLTLGPTSSWALPLKTTILDSEKQVLARAWVYIDYVEILEVNSKLLGKVGIVNLEGRLQLFLVRENQENQLVGWAAERKLYNNRDELIGYFDWTTFWVYAYSRTGKKLGQAKCIAFRGICATGVAGYLTGLFTDSLPPSVSPATPEQALQPKVGAGGLTAQ